MVSKSGTIPCFLSLLSEKSRQTVRIAGCNETLSGICKAVSRFVNYRGWDTSAEI